jgi:hypothetical protein
MPPKLMATPRENPVARPATLRRRGIVYLFGSLRRVVARHQECGIVLRDGGREKWRVEGGNRCGKNKCRAGYKWDLSNRSAAQLPKTINATSELESSFPLPAKTE